VEEEALDDVEGVALAEDMEWVQAENASVPTVVIESPINEVFLVIQ